MEEVEETIGWRACGKLASSSFAAPVVMSVINPLLRCNMAPARSLRK